MVSTPIDSLHTRGQTSGPVMAAAPMDSLQAQGHTDQNAHLNERGVHEAPFPGEKLIETDS